MVFISSSLKKIFPLTHWPAAPVGLTGEPVNPTGAAGQRYNRTLHTVMTTVIIAIKFVIVKSFFKQSLRLLIDLCIFGLSTIAQRECRHHAIANDIELEQANFFRANQLQMRRPCGQPASAISFRYAFSLSSAPPVRSRHSQLPDPEKLPYKLKRIAELEGNFLLCRL
ncbi:MAG: hypothetical protein ONB42_24245, partial [candidate division KSB1 bacterium]|nr:hypothetical protein [candidate division KSB1 bacterium]